MGITLEEDGFYYKGVRLVREDSPEYTSGREAYGGKDYCARVKLTVTADGDVALTTYSVHSGDLNSVTPDEFHQRTLYFQETEAQGTLRADSLQKMTDLIDAIEDDLKALQAGYTVKWNHKEFVGVLDANATAAYHNIQHTFARHAEAGLWSDNPVMDASEYWFADGETSDSIEFEKLGVTEEMIANGTARGWVYMWIMDTAGKDNVELVNTSKLVSRLYELEREKNAAPENSM